MLKFNNISPRKIFYRNNQIAKVKGCDGSDVWVQSYRNQYLTFVILADGEITFTGTTVDGVQNVVQFSKDNGATWATTSAITVFEGERVLCKGNCAVLPGNGIGSFGMRDSVNVEGNIMSLTSGDNYASATTVQYSHFNRLFENSYIVDASNLILPATTLEEACYSHMFYNSRDLIAAPELPATTLAEWCYGYMFANCSNLTATPVLSATTLVDNCYDSMFGNCTRLNNVTCLATDISANNCTNKWLWLVAATGTFTKAASMSNWTSGDSGIPNDWTVQNVA